MQLRGSTQLQHVFLLGKHVPTQPGFLTRVVLRGAVARRCAAAARLPAGRAHSGAPLPAHHVRRAPALAGPRYACLLLSHACLLLKRLSDLPLPAGVACSWRRLALGQALNALLCPSMLISAARKQLG